MNIPANEREHGKSRTTARPALADGWGILLIDSRHNPFLFVRELARGAQGAAQLCWSLNDQSYAVRKRGLGPISYERSLRPDRECRIARKIQRHQARLTPGAPATTYEFANLLSSGTLRVDDRYFRESYWSFYDGGGSLTDFLDFLRKRQVRPHALILNLAHTVLLAMQWLNSMEVMHLDLHAGNIFLRWDGDQLVPVIGDFGYSRLNPPLEPPFNSMTYLNSLSPEERRRLSSPPPSVDDPDARLPLDFSSFAVNFQMMLQQVFRTEEGPQHNRMHQMIQALVSVGIQENINDDAPEEERPPRVNITAHIAQVKVTEQYYLEIGGQADNQAALDSWREHCAGKLPSPVYGTKGEATAYAERHLSRVGPYEVVSLSNPASIQIGVDLLATATGHPGSRQSSLASSETGVNRPGDGPSGDTAGFDRGQGVLPGDIVDIDLSESGTVNPELGGSVNPAGPVIAINPSTDWFERVFIPAAEHQYIEKYKARDRSQPWEGRLFPNVDASVPGPSGEDRQAVREWLRGELLPLFEQQVRDRQATRVTIE